MRVDPNALQAILRSDKARVLSQAYACQLHIDAVHEASQSDSGTQGAAYDSARAYLMRVKTPALQCQLAFLDALASDIDSDIAALHTLMTGDKGTGHLSRFGRWIGYG